MSARVSFCRSYRYWLTRPAETLLVEKSAAVFVMLNPSTADAEVDDPTIRRCRAFARTWNCNGLVVANLYAFRATNPDDLWVSRDPVGPDNDFWLSCIAETSIDIVCAWGVNAGENRVAAFMKIAEKAGARLWCLGTTKSGAPRHPLYVKSDQPLLPWPSGGEA